MYHSALGVFISHRCECSFTFSGGAFVLFMFGPSDAPLLSNRHS